MLNINVKANLDVSIGSDKKEYPIYFERKNICVCCGAERSLKFVDKFGSITSKEIYPFDHIICTNCGATYSISWKRDSKNGRYYPVPVDSSIKQDFLNIATGFFENRDRNI